MSTDVIAPRAAVQPPRIGLRQSDEVIRPQPRGEAELDADTEWDEDWPSDEDGDWSGCAYDGDAEDG